MEINQNISIYYDLTDLQPFLILVGKAMVFLAMALIINIICKYMLKCLKHNNELEQYKHYFNTRNVSNINSSSKPQNDSTTKTSLKPQEVIGNLEDEEDDNSSNITKVVNVFSIIIIDKNK